LFFPERRCPDKEQFDCFYFTFSFVNPNFLETIPMKYDLTEKKVWITPGIEEASVQTTEARQQAWFTEGTYPRRPNAGEEPEEVGGPS
jgi:hypothetical protein